MARTLVDGIRKKENADKYCKMLLEALQKQEGFESFWDPGPEHLWISERRAYGSSWRTRSTLFQVKISDSFFFDHLYPNNLHKYPYISRLHNVRTKKETPHAATERARLAAVAIREAGAGNQGGFVPRPGGIIAGEHEEATAPPGQYTATITGIDHATRTVTLATQHPAWIAHIPLGNDWTEDDEY